MRHALLTMPSIVLAEATSISSFRPSSGLAPARSSRTSTITTSSPPVAPERLWGDLPPEDLATAGRVLGIVLERANVELARSDSRLAQENA
jgi:hypothetical protein